VKGFVTLAIVLAILWLVINNKSNNNEKFCAEWGHLVTNCESKW
jgi:hypothetical protein